MTTETVTAEAGITLSAAQAERLREHLWHMGDLNLALQQITKEQAADPEMVAVLKAAEACARWQGEITEQIFALLEEDGHGEG